MHRKLFRAGVCCSGTFNIAVNSFEAKKYVRFYQTREPDPV